MIEISTSRKFTEYVTNKTLKECLIINKINLRVKFYDDIISKKKLQQITKFKNIEEIILPNQEISKIYNCLLNLKNITYLNLNNNNIIKIPKSIPKLYNLKILYLGGNQITKIPRELYDMKKLQGLYLWENKIKKLPPQFYKLSKLSTLDIMDNIIIKIPEYLNQNNNFTYYIFYFNKISSWKTKFYKKLLCLI